MPSIRSVQNITPCLWFDTNAAEAAEFYTSVFPNSRVLSTSYYTENMHMAKDTVLTVEFELMGQRFTALNGGPHFKFTEAISLMVHCDSQAEIDEYWSKLTADGGAEVQCGWLRDKFGLSWQIAPREVADYVHGPRSAQVMHAVMSMVKLDVAKLRAAAGV
jgi:predicted 3-demethylubiquinone-9 3-methyltransferase (glyoxalase superfamily)